MIYFNIIGLLICGALNAIGGHSWHNARRFVMPILIAILISINIHIWWVGIISMPVIGTLCLGYFGGNNFGRALWLFLQAIVIGIGLLLTGHILWYFYLGYIIGAGVLGGIYKNWKQILGDSISGSYLAIIVFLVR